MSGIRLQHVPNDIELMQALNYMAGFLDLGEIWMPLPEDGERAREIAWLIEAKGATAVFEMPSVEHWDYSFGAAN